MGQKSISGHLLNRVLTAPEDVLEVFDLVYVHDRQLTIERTGTKRKFSYRHQGKPLTDPKHLERIKRLAIPPAWSDVQIAHLANGHLQAVGRDAKQRKQYRYHPAWNRLRNQTKFYRLVAFAKTLPKIRKQTDRDLQQKTWTKSKVLALIVKLMEATHIRIGSLQYAKRNQTFGLSTFRSKHLHVFKDKMKFEFIGKKGKRHIVTLKNKKLVRLVLQCEEIPGWELFQYYDGEGVKHHVDSTMVNAYLNSLTGGSFTAKDFRTWTATVVCFETLLAAGPADHEKEIKANLLNACEAAATALGNTRSVCQKYYVHPAVISAYENGRLHAAYENVASKPNKRTHLSKSEQTVVKLIRPYKPQL